MMAALEKYMDNIPIRRKFMQLYIVCVLVPLIITDSVVLYIVGGMERERERQEMAKIATKDLGHSEIVDHGDPGFVKMLCGMNIHE